jgi:predicted O-linked N-acetylglucosamine transferase (SPINDLY family)
MTAPSLNLFETAIAHYQAGRRTEAEAAYRQILSLNPQHADALHNLGVLFFESGNHALALDLINRAIAVNPGKWEYFSNLGLVLLNMGRNEETIIPYKRSLELHPGNLMVCHNLGSAFQKLGRFEEAIAFYSQALHLDPNSADTWLNCGQAMGARGRTEEAIKAFNKFALLRPDSPVADYHLGMALFQDGQYNQCIDPLFRALTKKPDDPEIHDTLGMALHAVGRVGEAITAHSMALHHKPNVAAYYRNLGKALESYLRFPEAVDVFRRSLALEPENAEYHNNLGCALRSTGQLDEAIACFERTAALLPDSPMGLNNIGNTYKDMGRLDEAIAWFDRALALEPQCAPHHSNRVYLMYFHPGYDAQEILREHRRWNDQHARPLQGPVLPRIARDPNRRLRIGYVSPDFREHVVGQNILPLVQNHDRRKFEVFCYSNVSLPDSMTEKFQAATDHWREIATLSDDKAAELILQDKIDILVDLALHMASNRLLVFARKPAPIQATFGGYPGTTGMETIDYRLSDPHLDPAEFDNHYTEKTLRLADSFWCYDPIAMGVDTDPSVNELPALKNGYITFGSLNNFCKINDGMLELWAKIMIQVENSHLLLITPQGQTRANLAEKFQKLGIDPSRLQLVDRQEPRAYFLLHHQVDISLDTLPYNGHTTNLDSLWMGVPVVTMPGRTVVGRAGLSHLRNLNLKELMAYSREMYVEIAVKLARDLPRLTQLRSTLRDRMRQSPLCDPVRFARNVEAAYLQMS